MTFQAYLCSSLSSSTLYIIGSCFCIKFIICFLSTAQCLVILWKVIIRNGRFISIQLRQLSCRLHQLKRLYFKEKGMCINTLHVFISAGAFGASIKWHFTNGVSVKDDIFSM